MQRCCGAGACRETVLGGLDCRCNEDPQCPAYVSEVFSGVKVEMVNRLYDIYQVKEDSVDGEICFPFSGDHLFLSKKIEPVS